MRETDGEISLCEKACQPFSNIDGAVFAAGASDADGQITLMLFFIKREHVVEQIGQLFQEPASFRIFLDIGGDGRIGSRLALELRNKVRVGEKADVEKKIDVMRHAELEAESRDGNHHSG